MKRLESAQLNSTTKHAGVEKERDYVIDMHKSHAHGKKSLFSFA